MIGCRLDFLKIGVPLMFKIYAVVERLEYLQHTQSASAAAKRLRAVIGKIMWTKNKSFAFLQDNDIIVLKNQYDDMPLYVEL